MKKILLFLCPAVAIFAEEAAPSSQSGLMQTFIMIGIALVFFYFILWRPEQKRRKAAEQMRGSLKKGDRVTAMGIVGKVDRIHDQTVVLQMAEGGAKIEVLKGAITDVQSAAESKAESTET